MVGRESSRVTENSPTPAYSTTRPAYSTPRPGAPMKRAKPTLLLLTLLLCVCSPAWVACEEERICRFGVCINADELGRPGDAGASAVATRVAEIAAIVAAGMAAPTASPSSPPPSPLPGAVAAELSAEGKKRICRFGRCINADELERPGDAGASAVATRVAEIAAIVAAGMAASTASPSSPPPSPLPGAVAAELSAEGKKRICRFGRCINADELELPGHPTEAEAEVVATVAAAAAARAHATTAAAAAAATAAAAAAAPPPPPSPPPSPLAADAVSAEELRELLEQQQELRDLLLQAKHSLTTLERVFMRQDARLQLLSKSRSDLGDVLQPLPAAEVVASASSAGEVVASASSAAAGVQRGGGLDNIADSGRGGGGFGDENEAGHVHVSSVGASGRRALSMNLKSWSNHMELLSAVKIAGSVSVVHPLAQRYPVPSQMPITGVLPMHIVLGDHEGRLHVFTPDGELVKEYDSGALSKVVAISSLYVRKNETIIASAHANGEVRIHSVKLETYSSGRGNPRAVAQMNPGIKEIELLRALPPNTDASRTISNVIAYRKKGSHQRSVAIWYDNGYIRVVKTHDGAETYSIHTHRSPVAVHLNGHVFVTLSAKHVTVAKDTWDVSPVDLRCEGLNGVVMVAACFDTARPQRAHALTDSGDLLTLLIPSDINKQHCKVISSQPSGVPAGSSYSMATLRAGYLILSHSSGVILVNVSTVTKGVAPVLSAESVAALATSMGYSHTEVPLPALGSISDKTGGFMAVSLGSGLVAFFDGGMALKLPHSMIPTANNASWLQPVMIGIMLIVAYFQFNRARTRASGLRGGGGTRLRASSKVGRREYMDDDDLFNDAVERMTSSAGAIPAATARRLANRAAARSKTVPMSQRTAMPSTIDEDNEDESD